jgi:hypothetical protein
MLSQRENVNFKWINHIKSPLTGMPMGEPTGGYPRTNAKTVLILSF